MSKHLTTAFLSLAVLLIAFPAAAQAQGTTLPEVRVDLPPALAACVRSCMSEGTSPRPADQPSCASVTDATARSRIETLSTEVRSIRATVSSHSSTLASHGRRIAELERQMGLLGTRTTALESEVRELREAMTGIRADITSLNNRYELLMRDYVGLALRVGVLETRFRELSTTVADLSDRVTELENFRPVRFGPSAGFMAVWSGDGTSYTGFPLGAQLMLNLTRRDYVLGEGGVAMSGGSAPVSTYARAAYGHSFTPMWGIETGVGGYWLGLNDQVKARSTLVLGDVGVLFTPHRVVRLTAAPMIGAEFDQGSPAVAGGFRLNLSVVFP